MNLDKLEKESHDYAISRTYPRFENNFIANFVLKEIEGAYFNGEKNMAEKYERIINDIKNTIIYRFKKDGDCVNAKSLIDDIDNQLRRLDYV